MLSCSSSLSRREAAAKSKIIIIIIITRGGTESDHLHSSDPQARPLPVKGSAFDRSILQKADTKKDEDSGREAQH